MLFQQDNASVHTSHLAKEWFAANNVSVLPWRAKSPDMSPIETMWSILVRKVYEKGKQYFNMDDLVRAIRKAWEEVTKSEVVLNLIQGMPDRVYLLIEAKGATIHKS